MIQILDVSNMNGFVSTVSKCRGPVLLTLPDRTQFDLKRNRAALELLRALKPGRDGLCLAVPDPGDRALMFNYLAEATREPAG